MASSMSLLLRGASSAWASISRTAEMAMSTAVFRTSAIALLSASAIFSSARRLRGGALRLDAGMGDDLLGLLERVALLALIVGEHALRLLAQPVRLFQLGLDLAGAIVERLGDDRPGLARQPAEGDGESDEHPEFGIVQQLEHQPRSRSTASTAAAVLAASTSMPASFAAAARATSTATPRMLR